MNVLSQKNGARLTVVELSDREVQTVVRALWVDEPESTDENNENYELYSAFLTVQENLKLTHL